MHYIILNDVHLFFHSHPLTSEEKVERREKDLSDTKLFKTAP